MATFNRFVINGLKGFIVEKFIYLLSSVNTGQTQHGPQCCCKTLRLTNADKHGEGT